MLIIIGAADLALRPLPVFVLLSTTLTPFSRGALTGSQDEACASLAPTPVNSPHLPLSSRDSARDTVARTAQGLVWPIPTLRIRRWASRRTRSIHNRPSPSSADLPSMPSASTNER